MTNQAFGLLISYWNFGTTSLNYSNKKKYKKKINKLILKKKHLKPLAQKNTKKRPKTVIHRLLSYTFSISPIAQLEYQSKEKRKIHFFKHILWKSGNRTWHAKMWACQCPQLPMNTHTHTYTRIYKENTIENTYTTNSTRLLSIKVAFFFSIFLFSPLTHSFSQSQMESV